MKVQLRQERCKECGLCIAHCPKDAICFQAETNSSGYHPTIIDEEKCIACGTCYVICPDGVYHVLGKEE